MSPDEVMSFFKRWLLRVFDSVVVFVVLTAGFGILAGTYWMEYAWGSTAIFAAVVFGFILKIRQ